MVLNSQLGAADDNANSKLISHQLSSRYHDDCMRLYNSDNPKFDARVSVCNSIIRWVNLSTSITLALGIISLVLFCSINAYNMSKTQQTKQDVKVDATKGRTISQPVTQSGSNSNNSTKK